jgi:hypothetical protein
MAVPNTQTRHLNALAWLRCNSVRRRVYREAPFATWPRHSLSHFQGHATGTGLSESAAEKLRRRHSLYYAGTNPAFACFLKESLLQAARLETDIYVPIANEKSLRLTRVRLGGISSATAYGLGGWVGSSLLAAVNEAENEAYGCGRV